VGCQGLNGSSVGIATVTSRTIPIDHEGTARLNLFQLLAPRSGCGTRPRAALVTPEVILGGSHTGTSDVYVLGVMLTELGMIERPSCDALSPNDSSTEDTVNVSRVARCHLRPTIPVGCSEAIAELAGMCLSSDPSQRPSPSTIVYKLWTTTKTNCRLQCSLQRSTHYWCTEYSVSRLLPIRFRGQLGEKSFHWRA
jgi:serine/threonine protein kinase